MIKNPRIFVGPMSKNIVDAVIELANETKEPIGLIPSRRQVEHNGGYVNNWTTNGFCEYVRSKTNNVLLVRDHSGPKQGLNPDDGLESFLFDIKENLFDVIHIDVWKEYSGLLDGAKKTVEFIKTGYQINPDMYYEIGTEEAIRPFSTSDLEFLILYLKKNLDYKEYDKIKYLVIQSGTALKGNNNIGIYDQNKLEFMVNLAKKYNLISKEHNGDYLSVDLVNSKFNKGLDCINIAPEFGGIETKEIIKNILNNKPELLDGFYQICFNSKKWVKWVQSDFKPEDNKIKLIEICGHYVFSEPKFIELTKQLPDITPIIKEVIKNKLRVLSK